MTTDQFLPTWTSATWTVAAFRHSLVATLESDDRGKALSLYFYAVTIAGWNQVRESVRAWRDALPGRQVLLVAGTDHGITDPVALAEAQSDAVDVRVMVDYHGVFHPKMVWLRGHGQHVVWVGSNNLTRDGLLNNVEFATVVNSATIPKPLEAWASSVEARSVSLNARLLSSYRRQRRRFEQERAAAGAVTFTLKERAHSLGPTSPTAVKPGDLVVEVMPRETGPDGRQVQLPMEVARQFFGMGGIGTTRTVHLQSTSSALPRTMTLTVFSNRTVRLVISELEYRDRPCVIAFRKTGTTSVAYEIVAQGIFPTRYRTLLGLCTQQTRKGSRRWGIV